MLREGAKDRDRRRLFVCVSLGMPNLRMPSPFAADYSVWWGSNPQLFCLYQGIVLYALRQILERSKAFQWDSAVHGMREIPSHDTDAVPAHRLSAHRCIRRDQVIAGSHAATTSVTALRSS